ncbi:MAG: PHP domain-containing protein [Clostridia bacterium]|nr:PHP domain-containing protein [Clostridia bacterium]
MDTSKLIDALNAETREERLDALREVKARTDAGELPTPEKTDYVNNHIHTIYSFSPYSPTKALYMAWQAGLKTAGIMDHDSIAGAREFIEAGEIIGMPTTIGSECRVSMANTAVNGKKINNPDQSSVAYCAMHGIPHQFIDELDAFFEGYRRHRNLRNLHMCRRISELTAPYGITLDFKQDVLPLSCAWEGGSVTERHITFALAKKITARYPNPADVVNFLENEMKLPLSAKVRAQILDGDKTPQFYEYDILGALKSNMVEQFYIPATDECPDVTEYIDICRRCGIISAYAYLGDVGDSVTGDKKTQKFEDDYLDLLISELKRLGFNAITYMPSRNTKEQLQRLMKLCADNGFFEISGEDINSPRQSFICKAMADPMFAHLSEATYALIGHEQAATASLDDGLFSAKSVAAEPSIKARVSAMAAKAVK